MINKRIRELRLSRGMSQPELAAKLGVSKQCISNWENDNIQPSIEMLIAISRFFMVSTDYLLGIDNKKIYRSFHAYRKANCSHSDDYRRHIRRKKINLKLFPQKFLSI